MYYERNVLFDSMCNRTMALSYSSDEYVNYDIILRRKIYLEA